MSIIRIFLLAVAGFFLFRLVRSVIRTLTNARASAGRDETVGGRKTSRPLDKPFRDATDASFEDLTGSGNEQASRDRPT